jgi:hypothetical protein
MAYLLFNKYPYSTPLSVISNESRFVADSLNLRRQVVKKNAQRFEFIITVQEGANSTLTADLMQNWFNKGMELPFNIAVPQPLYTDSLTVSNSNIVVVANNSAGGSSITITSATPFSIPAGRMITFSNHSKVYVVKTSIVSQTSTVLQISPSLVKDVPVNSTVNVKNVNAAVLNEADNSSFSYESGIMQSATLKFIEYLS